MTQPVVKKEDVLKASSGMLQMQLYAVFTKPTAGLDAVMGVLEEHLEYQISLEKRGIMFGAGPFWDDSEERWLGEGMVIIRAASLAEADAVAAADPMHRSGARAYTIRPWLLNEGCLTLTVRYSDGSREVT